MSLIETLAILTDPPAGTPVLTDPAYPGAEVYFLDIAPATAGDIIDELMPVNRKEKIRKSGAFTRDIAAGRFFFNGDTIRFYADGALADGRHRLKAIREGGKTVRVLIVRGLARDALPTIDSGTARSGADALTILGHVSALHLQALARKVLLYQNGTVMHSGGGGSTAYAPSNEEIVKWVEDGGKIPAGGDDTLTPHVLIRAAASTANRADGCGLNVTNVAFIRWLLLQESPPAAVDWFFGKVRVGGAGPRRSRDPGAAQEAAARRPGSAAAEARGPDGVHADGVEPDDERGVQGHPPAAGGVKGRDTVPPEAA